MYLPEEMKVATTEMSMPAAATPLPRRAHLGLPRPLRARMKVVADTR